MNELKKLNEGGTPSERPFLLIYTNKDNVVNYEWLKTKEELLFNSSLTSFIIIRTRIAHFFIFFTFYFIIHLHT